MSTIRLENKNVFMEDGRFHKANIIIEDGYFKEIDTYGFAMNHLGRRQEYLIPGLVDIHLHGAMNADFSSGSEEEIRKIAAYEASCGVTTIFPTTMSVPKDEILKSMKAIRRYDRQEGEARILGITMEGPFLSPEKKGAHDEKNLILPDSTFFNECQEASGGLVRQVVVAPELEGATAFIIENRDKVVISLGHSAGTYDKCCRAFDRGATHVTHLFNAMSPFNHRDPGLIGAARDFDCYVEVICDGVHIHQSMIRAICDLFPADRICLISDSMEATGLADGQYALGGQSVTVNGNQATLTDGTIAGSVTNLMDCMKTAIDFGMTRADAIRSASLIPARSLHLDHEIGSIKEGKRADFVAVDEDFNINYVCVGGEGIVDDLAYTDNEE